MRKKKTDKKIEQTKTKSRAKYECTEDLNQQISFFNLVPFSCELPSPPFIFVETKYNKPHKQEADKGAIKEIFEEIPENLARHITECYSHTGEQLLYYINYYYNHLFLRNAVNFFAKCREAGFTSEDGEMNASQWDFTSEDEEINASQWEQLLVPAQISAMVVIDGKVNYKHMFPVGEILRGIEYDRLRSCAICEKIFWAKNKNSETCSEPCRNALRQRRHRKKNKEAVNAKRQARYQRKKQEKELAREERRKALLDNYKKE
jgi:predicted nucleic acid-binding Zn ribbon protein